jgi:pyruvate,orthophosphate dikinase
MGLSRDDAGRFLPSYIDGAIPAKDPFVSLDQSGVGERIELAAAPAALSAKKDRPATSSTV